MGLNSGVFTSGEDHELQTRHFCADDREIIIFGLLVLTNVIGSNVMTSLKMASSFDWFLASTWTCTIALTLTYACMINHQVCR